MIEVRLFATLRKDRGKILFLLSQEFRDGYAILEHLHIQEEEVAIYLINGFHSKLGDPLKAGDVVAVFPPVGGG